MVLGSCPSSSTMASLYFQLQINDLCVMFNRFAESVKHKAPDSITFHSYVDSLHSELEHLRASIKAWNRILSLGSIEFVPPNAIMDLQRERSRISHKIQLLQEELNRAQRQNIQTGFGGMALVQQQGYAYQMQPQSPSISWTAFGPGFHTSGNEIALGGSATTPAPNIPNGVRNPIQNNPYNWNWNSSDSGNTFHSSSGSVLSSNVSSMTSAASAYSSGSSRSHGRRRERQ